MGYGLLGLKILGFSQSRPWAESWALSFALGMGTVGWLLFWVGIASLLTSEILAGILIIGLGCFFTLWSQLTLPKKSQFEGKTVFILAIFIVGFCLDGIEALAPPADADTLAYHFAIPKRFLEKNSIEFIPYAVDGAIPLLTHLTYALGLGLGGELTLNLWVFFSQGFLILGVYGVARRRLPRLYAMMISLVLYTTAGMIFAGGTGQIEPKTALFMLLATVAVADGIQKNKRIYFVLAGLLAGFFLASKYHGIFAAVSLIAVIFFYPSRFSRVGIFSFSALLSGAQWYGWNTFHTGMPIFPTMYSWGLSGWGGHWDADIDARFTELMGACLPESIFSVLIYPILATLSPQECWDNQRTGLGPYLWFLLPATAYLAWNIVCNKVRVTRSSLFPLMLPAMVFYMLWVLIPSGSLITRHLLPIYPLILIGVSTSIYVYSVRQSIAWLRLNLVMSMMFSIAIGVGIQFLYSQNYFKYHWAGETRDDFYQRNISYYEGVRWVNGNLPKTSRIAHQARYHNYLLAGPYFLISPKMRIALPPEDVGVVQVRQAFCRERIGYLMFVGTHPPYRDALELDVVYSSESQQILSRTLSNLSITTNTEADGESSNDMVLPGGSTRRFRSPSAVSIARIKWEAMNSYDGCAEVDR